MMKKIFCVWLVVLLLGLGALSGCQRTPEKTVVQGKNIDRLLEEAQETTQKISDTPLKEKLKIPDTYTNSMEGAKGKLKVNIDAGFNLPDADKLPTAKIGMAAFSQETADKLMKALLHGQTLYDLDSYLQETKADIQKRLVELYAMQAGTIPVQVDGDIEESIRICENQLKSAPEEIIKEPAQTTFHKKSIPGLEPYDCIEGAAEINGRPVYFTVQNWTEENRICVKFFNAETVDLNGGKYERLEAVKAQLNMNFTNMEPKISAEAAQAQADGLVKDLGLSYMECGFAELGINLEGSGLKEDGSPDFSTAKTAYIFQYTRKVNGVPITYTWGDDGGSVETEENYAKPWPYESVAVIIDDTGIIEFQWVSPYTGPDIVTQDTKLMMFPEIRQIFEKMIVVKNSWGDNAATVQMDINTVRLGLMRVTNREERNSGILIPVWDFFGTTTYKNEKEQWINPCVSLLTINAVDGTIIDRSKGY
jgi:hypothetical protein